MNPYGNIRKVPLDYNGIESSAYAIQFEESMDKWKEVGVVSNNYMLIENKEVAEIAEHISEGSSFDWREDRTFFNGKKYFKTMIAKGEFGEVENGDPIGLGMGFWNSYDGSTSFRFRMFTYNLICTNGMMTKKFFGGLNFKHVLGSSNDYEEEIVKAISVVNNSDKDVNEFIQGANKLVRSVNIDNLADIRYKHLQNVPTTTWGQVVDQFLSDDERYVNKTGWDLLNSATDVLWHSAKPNVAKFETNQIITDGLLDWAQAQA